jgi:hypothetical protein
MYHWASQQSGLMLIAGHTHAPVFGSYSHRARLIKDISQARTRLASLSEAERAAQIEHIEKLTTDLLLLESKLSPEELRAFQPGEDPRPCYFNTGCCAFEDGDITGIELADGEIRLVRWPDDDNRPMRKVLQAESLENIFYALAQKGA